MHLENLAHELKVATENLGDKPVEHCQFSPIQACWNAMSPWLETMGVCGLAILGAWLGWRSSRLPKPFWLIGYFIPLILIVIIGLARRYSAFQLTPPISWIMAGRTPFALTGIIGTMILTTPLSRLANRRDKIFVVALMIAIVCFSSVWPFLAPAFNRHFLASIQTRVDSDGVCLQNSDYTCGPASAVTALHKLGFPAEEGELALLGHTSNAMGTPPGILCEVLQKKYGSKGLIAEFRHFRSVSDLKQAGLTIALTKFGLMVDHYVVILEVTETSVIVGDPLLGKTVLSHDDFKKKWRNSGIVMKRKSASNEHE